MKDPVMLVSFCQESIFKGYRTLPYLRRMGYGPTTTNSFRKNMENLASFLNCKPLTDVKCNVKETGFCQKFSILLEWLGTFPTWSPYLERCVYTFWKICTSFVIRELCSQRTCSVLKISVVSWVRPSGRRVCVWAHFIKSAPGHC